MRWRIHFKSVFKDLAARPCAPLCGLGFPPVPKYDFYVPSARRFFAAAFSRTFGAGLFKAIAGRGLTAVLAVFVQNILLCLQFPNEPLNYRQKPCS
jgi:hypothetical protein